MGEPCTYPNCSCVVDAVCSKTLTVMTIAAKPGGRERGERAAWNAALEEAAKMANARFLVDPLTSAAVHILGLKK